MKNLLIALSVVVVLIVGYIISTKSAPTIEVTNEVVENPAPVVEEEVPVVPEEVVDETKTVIGTSVDGNAITAYHYGEGDTELLFVGGIHGGYEWNTVLLAHELMEYLEANPAIIPDNVKVTIIPALNPDGLEKVVGTTGTFTAQDVSASSEVVVSGRFNANDVDLNRNFACDWKATGVWQNKSVSGGTEAFSEPESRAVRAYVDTHDIAGAVVWYSAAGGVYASNCYNGVLPRTEELTSMYATASGYPAHKEFNYYEITGDMVNWLASEKIPAISVLLTNHTDIEWTKNKAGVEAILKAYAN